MGLDLSGRRVLVTGASRGIGRRCVEALLDAGALVLGTGRRESSVAALTAELGESRARRFWGMAADLGESASYADIAARVRELWGALDVLVNNAGVMLHHDGEISGEPEGILETTFEINLFAPMRLTRAMQPLLEQGRAPRVVNVSSDAGTHQGMTEPGIAAYRLSKWSLNGLTMLQAKEFAGRISVVALDPGWVRTDMGGTGAPGDPRDSATSLLEVLRSEPEVTGKLFRDGRETDW